MKYMGFRVLKQLGRFEKIHRSFDLDNILKVQRRIERLTGLCPEIMVKYIKDKPLFLIKRT